MLMAADTVVTAASSFKTKLPRIETDDLNLS
jgi:hypothetical protein